MTINTNVEGYALQFSCKFMRSIPYGEIKIINGIISEINIPDNKMEKLMQVMSEEPDLDLQTHLDAESDQNILLALVHICEHNFNDSDIIEWVSKNGFLTVAKNSKQESIEAFKKEAVIIADLWKKLAEVRLVDVDMDIEALQKWIEFVPSSYLGGNRLMSEYKTKPSSVRKDVIQSPSRENYEKNPRLYLQRAGFRYVLNYVLPRLEGVVLDEIGINEDNFTVRPNLSPDTLLQYLYLKFLIVLCDTNKRICPVCYKVFTPTRKDRIYCEDPNVQTSCRATAKSRRQAARQKAKRHEAKLAQLQAETILKQQSMTCEGIHAD